MLLSTAPVVDENVEELDVAKVIEEGRVRKLKHLMVLVVEFRGGNNLAALEKWLSELDVSWVLHEFKIDESAGSIRMWRQFSFFAESWILALQDINESVSRCFDVTSRKPLASEFVLLVETAVLKMLPFVDAIIAAAVRTSDRPEAIAAAAAQKLQVLIDVSDALSMASEEILPLLSSSSPCIDSTDDGIGMMREHLSTELAKLDEAIWDTMVDMRAGTLVWMEDNGRCGHPCGSSDIHKVTHSIISYTEVLWANYGSLNCILDGAYIRGEFKPHNQSVSHLANLIMETVCSIEDKLARKSQSWFPDESLWFLFLINNACFMLQKLQRIWRLAGFPVPILTLRIDDYINGYLIVSWVPVLRCLCDPATLCCFARTSSPLKQFESTFHKTCAMQKLWKVPDPNMKKRIRKAIVEKVIPVLTQFLEDNSISAPPGVTPKKLEEMLGELFEG
ncbi:uncharacterized protein LOC120668885 isoform X2 [Panicum virgatum]|nr:uncharacterized protein LOC120668885 isoform X2 [Panicum virgatum]KAG2608603.1 hypothetical protein PVAP13_4NG336100 [Panicum virgatum]KAG2608604.1 hypothetical protein PVAP13_4NG336100 [Panicum virgatum]KAG2608605.1 hypothetical protein PVAP13_4NG336100 [Panicum virgatum]